MGKYINGNKTQTITFKLIVKVLLNLQKGSTTIQFTLLASSTDFISMTRLMPGCTSSLSVKLVR